MPHDTLTRAESIQRTILRHDCLIAVFAKKQGNDYTFRTCKVGQIIWSAATNDKKDYLHGDPKLVGVYSPSATIDWIMDDLDYMLEQKNKFSFRTFK